MPHHSVIIWKWQLHCVHISSVVVIHPCHFATCHLVFCSTLIPGVHSTSHKANTTHLLYIHHYNDFWWLLSSGIWPHDVWYVGTPLGGIFSNDDGSGSCHQSLCNCVPVYTVSPCKKTDLWSWLWNLTSHIITAICFSTGYFIKYYSCVTYTYHMYTWLCYLQGCWQNHCQGIALMLILEMFSYKL